MALAIGGVAIGTNGNVTVTGTCAASGTHTLPWTLNGPTRKSGKVTENGSWSVDLGVLAPGSYVFSISGAGGKNIDTEFEVLSLIWAGPRKRED